MPSRSIFVLGVPRSGTSCVAGVLHKLGCDMGAGHFQPKDKFNPRGYFEDLRWRYANQRITGRGYSLNAANVKSVGKSQRMIWRRLAKECKVKPLWGIKDPWLCFVGQFVWPQIANQGVDVRIVATHRKRQASIASVARHLKRTYKNRYKYGAQRIIDTWQAGMDARLAEFGGDIHHVQYEALVADPLPNIKALEQFAFGGLDISSNGQQVLVAQWVTPKLKHF